jgi:hypothetical protein
MTFLQISNELAALARGLIAGDPGWTDRRGEKKLAPLRKGAAALPPRQSLDRSR